MEKIKNVKPKPNSVDKHVGRNLKAMRMKLGISQEEIANSVDVSFQQIQKYESGKNRISASRMYQFAEALCVKPNDFYAGLYPDNTQSSENAEFIHSLDVESMKMLRLFHAIEDQDVKDGLLVFMKKCLSRK